MKAWATLRNVAIAMTLSINVAHAAPADEVRQVFVQFVAAQNAHDADRVETMLWDSPDFLWVSRGTQIRGVANAMATFRQYYSATWHLEPEMDRFQARQLTDDVVQILVPVTFTRAAAGQAPQDSRYLISQTLIRQANSWRIATILPIANTQLKQVDSALH